MQIPQLLGDRVLVEPIIITRTHGGILLPQVLQDEANVGGAKMFRVIAVGPGRRTKKGVQVPIECKPGDRVLCHSYFKGPVKAGDNWQIITSDQILMVYEAPKPPTQLEQ